MLSFFNSTVPIPNAVTKNLDPRVYWGWFQITMSRMWARRVITEEVLEVL